MNINWKVRLKNPAFWTGLVGVLATFAIGMAQLFGVDIAAQAGGWQQALTALITAVFGVLALLGSIPLEHNAYKIDMSRVMVGRSLEF